MKFHRFLYVVVVILFLFSCSITDSTDFPRNEFEFLDIEFRATVENRQLIEFRNQSSWEAFWNQHLDLQNLEILEKINEIDFQKNWVVGVFWGQSSGCTNQANQGILNVGIQNTKAVISVTDMPYTGACRMIVHPRAFLVFPPNIKSVEAKWNKD